MVLAAKKTDEQKKVDSYVNLLVSEYDFLRANGWVPVSLEGSSDVHWKSARTDVLLPQDEAVAVQKRMERCG